MDRVVEIRGDVVVRPRKPWTPTVQSLLLHLHSCGLPVPEPLGYDPASTFGSPDHADFGLLKLTPWRIALVSFPAPSHEEGQKIWRAQEPKSS